MSTVTVVPTVEASNDPPRVRLNITDTGTPAIFSTTVTRLNPDGTTSVVRTGDGNPLILTTSGSTRVGLLYDYEAPYSAAVSYSTVESPATVSAQVTVQVTVPWLIHPGVPALSVPVTFMLGSFDDAPQDVAAGVHYVMGRENPVVQTSGTRQGASGSFIVGTETLADLADLKALVQDAGILLLNVPATSGLGVDTDYIFVQRFNPKRRSDIGTDPGRNTEMTYLVVDAPVGGSQALRTYADVLATNATYASLLAKYPTYSALLAGP